MIDVCRCLSLLPLTGPRFASSVEFWDALITLGLLALRRSGLWRACDFGRIYVILLRILNE